MTDTKIVITAETAQAESALVRLNHKVDGASKGLLSFAGIAGALSIGAFAAFVKKSIDAADELAVLSEKTGTTVEALAGLKFAAEQNDTSLQSVALSAKKLSTSLAENPALFKQYGITATDTTGAMLQLSDIFQSMPDGVEKSALAVKLMGRSGEEMIPLLNQGSEALAGFITEGQKIYPVTAQSAAAARQFNDDFAKMQAQVSGLGMAIGADLVPALIWVVDNGIKPAIAGAKMLGVELAYFVQRTMAGIERLTSPSTWGKEGTEQYRRYLKELARIAEDEKINIAASVSGIGVAAAPSATPKATGSGRNLFKALTGGDAAEKADNKEAARQQAKEVAEFARQQEKIAAEIEREQAKFDKLHEIAVLYDATDSERITWKLAFDFDQMAKEREAAIAHKAWNAELEIAYNQARLKRTAMSEAEIGKLKKTAGEQQAKEGQQIMQQNFAALGERYRVFFEANKSMAISEIFIAGSARAEKASAWAATWGGVYAAAAAGVISWAATIANAGSVASMKFGGGGSVSGAGGVPSVSSSVMTPSNPVSIAPAPTTASTVAQAPREMNFYFQGGTHLVDMNKFMREQIIPAFNEAVGDGVTINVRAI